MAARARIPSPVSILLVGLIVFSLLSAWDRVAGPDAENAPRLPGDDRSFERTSDTNRERHTGRHGTASASSAGLAVEDFLTRTFSATVVHVADGDSLTARTGDTELRIRLEGVDCPELSQPYGAQARQITTALCLNRTVDIVPVEIDRYGRLIAEVFVDQYSLNRKLLAVGAAWLYHARESGWSEIESAARHRRLGLWSQARHIPPWEWRKSRERVQ